MPINLGDIDSGWLQMSSSRRTSSMLSSYYFILIPSSIISPPYWCARSPLCASSSTDGWCPPFRSISLPIVLRHFSFLIQWVIFDAVHTCSGFWSWYPLYRSWCCTSPFFPLCDCLRQSRCCPTAFLISVMMCRFGPLEFHLSPLSYTFDEDRYSCRLSRSGGRLVSV